ncbi:histidine-type phosphatase [bacterium]|nr:histidine-type phosphatase [bacterium]
MEIPCYRSVKILDVRFQNNLKTFNSNFYFRHAERVPDRDELTEAGRLESVSLGMAFANDNKEKLLQHGVHVLYAENNKRTLETSDNFIKGMLSVLTPLTIQTNPSRSLNDFNIGNCTENNIKQVLKKYLGKLDEVQKGKSIENGLIESLKQIKEEVNKEDMDILRVLLGDVDARCDEFGVNLGEFVEDVLNGINERLLKSEDSIVVSFTSRSNLSIIMGLKSGKFSTHSWVQPTLNIPPLFEVDI